MDINIKITVELSDKILELLQLERLKDSPIKDSDKTLTLIKSKSAELAKNGKSSQVRDLLKQFEVSSIADLSPNSYNGFLNKLNKL